MKKAKIITDPNILLGKQVIEGTRISVELILNLLKQGETISKIMEDYDLEENQVKAAVDFASKRVKETFPSQKVFAHDISTRRKFW